MRVLGLMCCALVASVVASCGGDDAAGQRSGAPASAINDGQGWRTVATFPDEPDPAGGYNPYPIVPVGAQWMGDVGGRLHVSVSAKALGTNAPAFDPGWISFSADGEAHPKQYGSNFDTIGNALGPPMVLDVEDRWYAWVRASRGGAPQLVRRHFDADTFLVQEVVFDGVGVLQSPMTAIFAGLAVSRTLDVAVFDDDPDVCPPTLYYRPKGASTGINAAIDRRELTLSRHSSLPLYYVCGARTPYVPSGGPAYVFQIATYSDASYALDVFTDAADTSFTYPMFHTLRRIHTTPVDKDATELHLLTTPTNAWVWLANPAKRTWQIFRFDRSTAKMVLAFEMPSPFDPTFVIDSQAITDDGALYVVAHGAGGATRVVRIVDGVTTDLWHDGIAKSSKLRFDGLYSTGARVYLAVEDTYPVTFTAGGDQTFDRFRFSFITPDLAAAPTPSTPSAPAPFVPPASCNPIMLTGCGAGEACDVGPSRNGFACATQGTVALCGACDPVAGPFCGPGTTCRYTTDHDLKSGQCVRLCCDGTDCGAGVCVTPTDFMNFPVGVCLTPPMYGPACSGMPSTPPSGGACVP